LGLRCGKAGDLKKSQALRTKVHRMDPDDAGEPEESGADDGTLMTRISQNTTGIERKGKFDNSEEYGGS